MGARRGRLRRKFEVGRLRLSSYMRAGFDDADKVAGLRHARGAIESGTDAAAEPIRSRGLCSAYCARTRGGRRGALRRGGVTISSRLSFDPECAPNARR